MFFISNDPTKGTNEVENQTGVPEQQQPPQVQESMDKAHDAGNQALKEGALAGQEALKASHNIGQDDPANLIDACHNIKDFGEHTSNYVEHRQDAQQSAGNAVDQQKEHIEANGTPTHPKA